MSRHIAIALAVLLAIVLALFDLSAYVGTEPAPEEATSEQFYARDMSPTDFSRVGDITVDTPGLQQGEMYLVYEQPGAPALTKRLVLDEQSVCGSYTGALPCMAMSVTFDAAFAGKRATIEGIEEGDAVRVRKLMTYPEGEEPRVTEPGSVFIPWMQARNLLIACEVSAVMQTHALDVYLTLNDGTRVRAVEPVIDEVFRVLNDESPCPSILVATE